MDFSQQQALLKERQRKFQECLGAEMEHSNLYGFRLPSRLPLCSTTSMDVNVSDLEDLSLDDMSNPGSLGAPDDLEYDFDDVDVFDVVDFEEPDMEKGGRDSSDGLAACCQQTDRQIPRSASALKDTALNMARLPAPVTDSSCSHRPASLTQPRTSSHQSTNISQQLDLTQDTCCPPDQCEGAIQTEGVTSNQSARACQKGCNYRTQLDNRETPTLQNSVTEVSTNNQVLEKETLV